ncbi:putative ABC transport system ATP-binding protein [Pedobacter sp. UYP24]
MISISSVTHGYGNGAQISFRDLKIQQGEKWLFLGDSGSGKTTLLHIIAGILRPSKGEVQIDDTLIYGLSSKKLDQLRGRSIGIVFQRPHLIASLTVKENLLVAQSFAGLKEDVSRITEVMGSLDVKDKLNSYPYQLSQGQLQRVSIARAVINEPSLLIADEPTSSLDDKNANAVLKLLVSQANLNHASLVIATHDKRVKDAINNIYTIS